MRSLEQILNDMDPALFEPSHEEPIPEPEEVYIGDESDVPIYQENIPNELARSLLQPKDYDPNCHYQLLTMEEGQFVVKIDDRISPEEEEKAVAEDPETNHLHIKEFPISSTEEVQSFKDMHDEVSHKMNKKVFISNPELPKQHKQLDYMKIVIPVLLVLFMVGCTIIYFLLNFAGK